MIGKNVISVSQFTVEDILLICDTAQNMERYAGRTLVTRVLEGAVLANLFFEPSTRTRISFGAAFNRLGGAVRDTTGANSSSLSKGESIGDTGRVVSGYSDVVVFRHPDENAILEFANASNVPVINGGNGPGEHPTQALLDYYTLRRELALRGKNIERLTLAITGDLKYGRTVHSLIKLLTLHPETKFALSSPPSLALPTDVFDLIKTRGCEVSIFETPGEALRSADALYATRLQSERFAPGTIDTRQFLPFRLDKALLDACAPVDIVIMHPLPRDSRDGAFDLANDLTGDSRLVIFRQTDAGIPVRMALFALVLGVADQIDASARPVNWHVRKPTSEWQESDLF